MEEKTLIVLSDHYLTFVKDQVEAVADSFSHIHVLVRYNPITEISTYFPIDRLKPFRKSSLIDLAGKPENISVHPIPVWFLPFDWDYKSLGKRYFRIVEAYIKRHNITGHLIHAHFIWPNGYVAIRIKEKYGIPCLMTAHGYDIYDLPFRDDEWGMIIKNVLDHADAIVSVSASNLTCINRLGTQTPVSVIPNGYRSDIFYPQDMQECRKQLGLSQDRTIILAIGNLVEEKGLKFLVLAMTYLIKKRPDMLCVIIGRGVLKQDLQKQIHSLGLDANVTLPGGRSHSEIPLWLNACDLFVFPSIRESFGIVQIEAMACGKPVVATINGGSEEIVNSSVGILVKREDAAILADAISLVLDSTWDSNAIVGYSARFSWIKLSHEIQELYQKILSEYKKSVFL
jgi:glycosyltransferase involved in cell wall biosynthesis